MKITTIFKKLITQRAQGFPVQIVMMTILGIVLLSMGFFLTATIFQSGDELSSDLSNQLRTNIDSRYCDGQSPLCAPRIVLRGRDASISHVNAVNLGSSPVEYRLRIQSSTQETQGSGTIDASCGTLAYQRFEGNIQIRPSTSAEIPIAFSRRNVNSRPCSFTTSMWLVDSSGQEVLGSRTPLIVRIE